MAKISNNSIMFIGLANEYCNLLESSDGMEKSELIDKLLKLLPRLYISISDFDTTESENEIMIEAYL